MRVALIRPPVYSAGLMGAHLVPPIGAAYVAAAARAAGHDVDLVDMCGEDIGRTELLHGRFVAYGMRPERLDDRLGDPDVIGFTCMFSEDWVFHRELIARVRRLRPQALLVAGGEHISALPEYSLQDCPELDACVAGEGEAAFVELLKDPRDLARAPSLVYRTDGGFRRNPRAPRIEDVDAVPRPAWDLVPMENYLSRGLNYHVRRGRTVPMVMARGCPFRCTFCSSPAMWEPRWIPRDPVAVVDEMEHHARRYRADNFVFSDLATVIQKEPLVRFCREILKRKLNVTWQLPTTRTESLGRGVLELMREAGCRDIDFSLESGSPDVLSSVRKGNSPSRMISLTRDAVRSGIGITANVIVGLPREGWMNFLETYRAVLRLALIGMQDVNVMPYTPFPGSALFDELRRTGRLTLDDDYFLGLFGYVSLGRGVPWSERFGRRTQKLLVLLLQASFYAAMLLSHPRRLVSLLWHTARGRPATKLEGVLQRMLINVGAQARHTLGLQPCR